MNKFCLAALAALALLAGCDTETSPVKSGYAKTNPADIKIYEHVPGRLYESLGTVAFEYQYVAGGASRLSLGESDPLTELREQAAARGADAIIIKEKDVYDSQDPSGTGGYDPGNGRRIRISGLAIKFTPPPAAPGPAAAPAMAPAGP